MISSNTLILFVTELINTVPVMKRQVVYLDMQVFAKVLISSINALIIRRRHV